MIAVIADDLSGAAELAGVALRHGLSAEVHTAFDPQATSDVVCIDTDSRGLTPEAAAERVARVAHAVNRTAPRWIFKKCDSVLRGAVAAEARAVAQAIGATDIVLASANPSRGRTIRAGRYYVKGVPLADTLFARDPDHPRLNSEVRQLLGRNLAGFELPDLETPNDVTALAQRVPLTTLAVGAADFFAALLATRTGAIAATAPATAFSPGGSSLLASGSAAAWPERRRRAESAGIDWFQLPIDETSVAATLQSKSRVLVGIGDGLATKAFFPADLVRHLGDAVSAILRQAAPNHLLLEGGATAAAVIRAAGWMRLHARGMIANDLAILQPATTSGPSLVIKPGSYPWPESVWPGL